MSYNAIIAGFCAAGGSFFGKLPSIISDTIISIDGIDKGQNFDDAGSSNIQEFDSNNQQLLIPIWLLKSISICLMIICNAMGLTFFVKGMHDKGGSLVATVTSVATNYCTSAILGYIMFNEKTSAIWWFGTILVIIGLLLISMEASEDSSDNSNKVNSTLVDKTKIDKRHVKSKNK